MESSKLSNLFRAVRNALTFMRKTNLESGKDSLEPGMLKVKVIESKFGSVDFQVFEENQAIVLKVLALGKFFNDPSFDTPPIITSEVIASYRLVRTKTSQRVADDKCLEDLKVSYGEEFLLLSVRSPVIVSIEDFDLSSPSELQIIEKTALLQKTKPQPPPFSIINLLLEDDMRKIFVTLAQESAYVLGLTPFADKLIDFYRKRIHYCIKHHKRAEDVLVQLGFSLPSVERAMKMKANNPKAALDWLIDNETASRYNEDHQGSRRTSYQRASSTRRGSILSAHFEGTSSNQERIEGLLEIVKFYAEKDEIVYQDSIREMVRMGFDVEVSREALRITRNNIAAAIAYISGDTNPSITELRSGLSETSEIRKKFMESHEIQLSLREPKNFALFVNILDNSSQANAWTPFSDVGSLMTHIIITYHEQKHVCATNQFNESRLSISALSSPN